MQVRGTLVVSKTSLSTLGLKNKPTSVHKASACAGLTSASRTVTRGGHATLLGMFLSHRLAFCTATSGLRMVL